MGKKSYCKGSQIAIAIYFIKFDYILWFKKRPFAHRTALTNGHVHAFCHCTTKCTGRSFE